MSNDEKIKVRIIGAARVQIDQVVTMPRAQYERLSNRYDEGDETVISELLEDWATIGHGVFDDYDIDDFYMVKS